MWYVFQLVLFITHPKGYWELFYLDASGKCRKNALGIFHLKEFLGWCGSPEMGPAFRCPFTLKVMEFDGSVDEMKKGGVGWQEFGDIEKTYDTNIHILDILVCNHFFIPNIFLIQVKLCIYLTKTNAQQKHTSTMHLNYIPYVLDVNWNLYLQNRSSIFAWRNYTVLPLPSTVLAGSNESSSEVWAGKGYVSGPGLGG